MEWERHLIHNLIAGDFIHYGSDYYKVYSVINNTLEKPEEDNIYHLQKCNPEFYGKQIHAANPEHSKEYYYMDIFKLIPENKIDRKVKWRNLFFNVIYYNKIREFIFIKEKVNRKENIENIIFV